MDVNINPWNSLDTSDACRVCSKHFCCQDHRVAHEMKEHKKLAPCLQTLPEICQKCTKIVSNINDLNSDCVRITKQKFGVLSEHSPNIIGDRPRKRTYSMMNLMKDSPSKSVEDCLGKRPKTQARKKIGSTRKILANSDSETVKKDCQETSPKFEEIKSSSTPIKRNQQDLRVKLLKSKLETSARQTSNVSANSELLSSHCQMKNSSHEESAPSQLEKSCELTPGNEKSIYGTPGSDNFFSFSGESPCDVHFNKGDPANSSIYTTPKTSLISVGTSAVRKGWTHNEELPTSNIKQNEQPFMQTEEKFKNMPKLLVEETESSKGLQISTPLNENMNKVADKVDTFPKCNEKLFRVQPILPSYISEMGEKTKLVTNIKEIAVDDKFNNSQEKLCIDKDCGILLESQVLKNSNSSALQNSEEKITNKASAFCKLSEKVYNVPNQSFYERNVENSVHIIPLNSANLEQNFAEDFKKAPALIFSPAPELLITQESPSNTFQQRLEDNKQLIRDESTPDSITEEVSQNQALNNNSFTFKPISNATEESKDKQPKFAKGELNLFDSSSTKVINVPCPEKCMPTAQRLSCPFDCSFCSIINWEKTTTTAQLLECPISCSFCSIRFENTAKSSSSGQKPSLENKLSLKMEKQPKRFKSEDESSEGKLDHSQVDELESYQDNLANTIYNSIDYQDDNFYTPNKASSDDKSFNFQPLIHLNLMKDPSSSSLHVSTDWKSCVTGDIGSQESPVQDLEDANNEEILINFKNTSDTSKEKNNYLNSCKQVCQTSKGNTTSNGEVSCFVQSSISNDFASRKEEDSFHQTTANPPESNSLKSGNLENSNLSRHHSKSNNMSSNRLITEAVIEMTGNDDDFPVIRLEKQDLNAYEEGLSSCFEDSHFKMVASTPMVYPKELKSASLDEDSINCTKNHQNQSSSKSDSKVGLLSLAKSRVKSYLPYFFNSKIGKSQSTEDLHSSSFQAQSLQTADITADISPIQKMDKINSEDENLEMNSQKILKRRPIWSWPKRRRPIHENRVRVTDDTFSNMETTP